jgi:hypothetical protein
MHFFHVILKLTSLGPGIYHMKSLKIPKGQSESVNRRRTDNTMTKRKWTKGQTTIFKTRIQKTKDRATRTPLKPWVHFGAREGYPVRLHYWYPLVAPLVAL